jgi:hypothetical protein
MLNRTEDNLRGQVNLPAEPDHLKHFSVRHEVDALQCDFFLLALYSFHQQRT